MANAQLYDKTFRIAPDVLQSIRAALISNPNGNGVKRAKYLLKNGVITYQALKRLKNFFDHFNIQNDDKTQYVLAGGELMKSFVDRTLNANRDAVSRSTEVRRDMTSNPNSELMPYQAPRINESDDKKEIKKNALAVIVNPDNKILLLKRGEVKNGWGNNQWSLVGGGVEKGETPEKAVEREIKEETDLDINKFTKTFTIQRHKGSIEHMFACRYDGDPTAITLNKENTNYGWFDVEEMSYLDTVPLLIEYINLVFVKYE